MKLEDLKCCGNCEHFDSARCGLEDDRGLYFPDPDSLCEKWTWDANTDEERIKNGEE